MHRLIKASKMYSNHPGDEHLEVVLANIGGYQPWVTWMYNKQDSSYFWGHYFEDYKDAMEDFNKRGRLL